MSLNMTEEEDGVIVVGIWVGLEGLRRYLRALHADDAC